ncbi:MAG: haloalkane dehalogenase [Nitrospirae bacterium]|nr:haloalkane dehalogenase [Nitrospirota bacterium]
MGSLEVLRTPDERFANLPGYPFAPHYAEVDGLRMHYVDEGPREADPILLLHGEPSWSYLYRKMVPVLAARGHRVIAPDLIGFGRSDKPVRREDYTYQRHVDWVVALIQRLPLTRITLFGQDWGGLIGLRILGVHPDLFSRAVASNTFLPTGDMDPGDAFRRWQEYSQTTPEFHVGGIVKGGCVSELPPEVIAAYDAPFPDDRYKAGARQFPMLVPTRPDDPASEPNRKAWQVLVKWTKPFLTAFADSDPITRGADRFLQMAIPGARGQKHTTIRGAGHFVQEDKGEELAGVIADFISSSPVS